MKSAAASLNVKSSEKASPTLLQERYFNGTQSINYEGLFSFMDHKLKVSIKKDSYDFQSSCAVSIFDKAKNAWNRLASIPFRQMQTVISDVYVYTKIEASGKGLRHHDQDAFKKDIEELLDEAVLILT